ncbi:MAG: hypothetical protein HKN29_10120 [Rhodothermales bacterium]|nr:hypothetical protein [Rhodothermales bacterium]
MPKAPEQLRDRAAQLLMPRLGSNMPPPVSVADDTDRAAALLKQIPVGGFVLFRGSRLESPPALARLQECSEIPLLFSSDLERGAGQQLHGATVFPHAMAFGEADLSLDEEAVFEAARWTAREAVTCGVHWLFAPVADVHSNPVNPIISTRAFGSSPEACARHVTAFIRGARAGGGLSTAKHFPGHGDTDTDSHDALSAVSRSRGELDSVELAPFRAAIEAGVDSVMTAHVSYPALDPGGRAATFSSPILRDLLRTELGFEGVVVSDSLLMGAAGREVSARAPELIAAGVDVLLDISHPAVAVDAIVRAVESGSLEERLVQDAFSRVWAMKERSVFRSNGASGAKPKSGAAAALAERVAEASLRLTGDFETILRGRTTVPLVLIRPHTDYPDPTRADAASILSAASNRLQLEEVGPERDPRQLERILERSREAGAAVVAMVIKPAAWHSFGLLDWQAAFAASVIEAAPTVTCLLGSPDGDRGLPGPAARLVSFSDVEPSVRAVASQLARALG